MTKIKLKRIILMCVIILISICAYQTTSLAASFSASASKTTLNVGDSTTLNVNIVDCVGKFSVSSSDSSVVSVSDTVIDSDASGGVTFSRK